MSSLNMQKMTQSEILCSTEKKSMAFWTIDFSQEMVVPGASFRPWYLLQSPKLAQIISHGVMLPEEI